MRIFTALCILTIFGSAIGMWAIGTRLFVIHPMAALPDGGILIVTGAHALNFIDSPEGVCWRKFDTSILCRAQAMAFVGENAKIVGHLPYSKALYSLTGAPEL